MVVAVPLPLLVERNQEQAGGSSSLQEDLAVEPRIGSVAIRALDGVAEGAVEALEDGAPDGPCLIFVGQAGQNLLGQVVLHLRSHALEPEQEGVRILLAAQRQRDEAETDGPSLHHVVQVGERTLAQAPGCARSRPSGRIPIGRTGDPGDAARRAGFAHAGSRAAAVDRAA